MDALPRRSARRISVVGIAAIIVIAVAIIGAIGYFAWKKRQAEIAALAALAASLGLQYSQSDPGNVLAMPFKFLRQGDEQKVRDFLVGTHDGRDLQLFDFDAITETRSTNAQGMTTTSHSHHHYTCGTITMAAACPELRIGQENFLSRLGSHIGVHDVEFESAEFNKEFRVHCDDQRFAFSLIDARMMEWLLTAAGSVPAIEVVGPFVFLAVNRMNPSEWSSLLEWFDQFLAHVPEVVYSTYPPR